MMTTDCFPIAMTFENGLRALWHTVATPLSSQASQDPLDRVQRDIPYDEGRAWNNKTSGPNTCWVETHNSDDLNEKWWKVQNKTRN